MSVTKSTATTKRKVLNYLARLADTRELEELAKAVEQRRRTVQREDRLARCRVRLDELTPEGWIVREQGPYADARLFFGAVDRLYQSRRWYVRGRHDGRKHVGLWVTASPDLPRGRKTSVFLPLEDALLWTRETVSETGEDAP
jgi:hypothetical protein